MPRSCACRALAVNGFATCDVLDGQRLDIAPHVAHHVAMRVNLAAVLLALAPAVAGAASWDPAAFAGQNTLQLKTTAVGKGEHWFPVWLVVVDDDVYVRLGSRAASRMERNTTAPYIAVRVAGQEFDRVKAVAMPEKAAAVGDAMARKYWSDVIVRHFNHPMTVKLVPEVAGDGKR
ncbi:MAG TPA: hypothetical protein VKU61_01020 [Candidatus Binatia bacterium]|nr:hypothetical protein [Candidatus Binatia bacterium]